MTEKPLTIQDLVHKAIGRNSLRRHEQRQLGLMLQDKIKQCTLQAETIRELRAEIAELQYMRESLEK